MDAKEIISKLEETLNDLDLAKVDLFREDYSDADNDALKLAVGEFEVVERGRAAVGDHDSYDIVYFFKEHNVYLLASGYYSSWSRTDWSDADFCEVKPVTKTITVYESV